ncbi:MAG: hypothetical protein R3242_03600, partial [Akkermansiaceae bacterium]|nr:hypothetical protein [Akkermansiaceae bacterium]
QTTVQEDPPHQSISLNYTMLGIWPERHHAYDISKALKEAGIESTMSGHRPCVLNVETAKLEQAYSIVRAKPEWMEAARISGAVAPAQDSISVTPAFEP